MLSQYRPIAVETLNYHISKCLPFLELLYIVLYLIKILSGCRNHELFKQDYKVQGNISTLFQEGPEGGGGGSQSHFPPEILAKSQSQLDFY